MAYKKPIVLLLFFLGSYVQGLCQQGGGLGQVPEDTLIRTRAVDNGGFKPVVNLNTFYRLHVGGAYSFVSTDSSTVPQSTRHTLGLNYSITEKSFHPYYKALIPHAVGDWNLALAAGYDGVRRVNYFGVGNETVRNPINEQFNWLRTENLYASVGIEKSIAPRHTLGFSLLYDGIRVMEDVERLAARKLEIVEPDQYNRQHFLGSRVAYSFISLNRPFVPTKGIEFTSTAAYTENLQRRGHSFARFTGDLDVYVPLVKQFSLAVRTGVATVTGNPDFYQLNTIGGTNTVRGYQRFRFYGKTSFYNQNELRWMPTINTRLYKGELGLFTLFDQGRVWHPGESSEKMHYGYGGGVILSPLKKVVIMAAYARSKEDGRFHINLKRIF